MPKPRRRTAALRRGRVSIPGARYFLTVVTQNRRSCLDTDPLRTACAVASGRLDADRDWTRIAMMVMPDHVHLLVTLGSGLCLDRAVSKWKTAVRRSTGWSAVGWQENFFDRRLRPGDSVEAFGRYMFLNPYRAGLVRPHTPWPGWYCWKPEWFRFVQALHDDPGVIPVWLGEPQVRPWQTEGIEQP